MKEKIRERSVLPLSRKEFSHYDNYLMVWDLVQKKGRKWKEIAKVIFPNDIDIDSARKKVANCFKAAEKIINAMGKS